MQEQQLLSNNCKCTAGLSESECASVESRCEKKFWFKRDESCPDLQTLRQNLETMFAAGHTTGTVDHPSIEVTGNRNDEYIDNPGIKIGHRDPTALSDSTNVLYVFVGTEEEEKKDPDEAKFSSYDVDLRMGIANQ